MIYSLAEIKERVEPVARKHHLAGVYVFGSYARGDATENSDVDLLVDYTADTDMSWCGAGVYADFQAALGKETDMVTTSIFTDKQSLRKPSKLRFAVTLNNERVQVYAA